MSGSWTFNETISANGCPKNTLIPASYTVDGDSYIGFYVGDDFLYYMIDGDVYHGRQAYNLMNNEWYYYHVVTFTTPFLRSTNPDFYDWFIQNAVKQ